MARPRTLPANDVLVQLLRDGWTYQRIADQYGTSREAVSALIARHHLAPPKTGRHAAHIPWVIAPAHRTWRELRYLRLYSRRAQGEQLAPVDDRALDWWLRELDDPPRVVAYSRKSGFSLVPREAKDGPGIVRRPASPRARGVLADEVAAGLHDQPHP